MSAAPLPPTRPTPWHRLDLLLARVRPYREPVALLADAIVVSLAWNVTYLFRLGFERWLSVRPSYDPWVMLGIVGLYLLAFAGLRCRKACGAFRASARSSG